MNKALLVGAFFLTVFLLLPGVLAVQGWEETLSIGGTVKTGEFEEDSGDAVDDDNDNSDNTNNQNENNTDVGGGYKESSFTYVLDVKLE